ncbi:MAG: Hsp20/alpha crystallin family protein [Tenuifilaceae bacterium]|jgi:HSP20 family protein|nr:Hsp20/alpha crystallin family protein [Bacteroidales bacterium]MDI9516428.1 Hsp20/alpha crystallin family protein [Bacteroidota bacterium]NLH55933.1 Hsp20/alpha crystallin family protein [Rikenellaceae bacterium]OQC63818.1 MAG: 18 kDa heat shock protein [Bacteroidetes bacterium ADurb.Bin008]HNS29116.1 Hsp20/alpha crystallin family protein [Tenuifilaceae bacterium]
MTLLIPKRSVAANPYTGSDEYRDFVNSFSRAFNRYAEECANTPAVNIYEEPKQFRIELAAPGYTKKDFSINVEKDVLTISANPEVKSEDGTKAIRCEFGVGEFQRSFNIGKAIDSTKIGASSKDGILTITLPKREEAIEKPPRSISVN